MKKFIFTIAILFLSLSTFGQSNKEIAGVYIRKAQSNYSNLEIDDAAKNFGADIHQVDAPPFVGVAQISFFGDRHSEPRVPFLVVVMPFPKICDKLEDVFKVLVL